MREDKSATTLSRMVRGHEGRKEARRKEEEARQLQFQKKGIEALEKKLRTSLNFLEKNAKKLDSVREDKVRMALKSMGSPTLERLATTLQAIGSPAARGPPVARGRASPRKKK